MTDYKQLAGRLRGLRQMRAWGIDESIENSVAIEQAAALCEAAAGGGDERERCVEALLRSGHTPKTSALLDLLMSERAAARAEGYQCDVIGGPSDRTMELFADLQAQLADTNLHAETYKAELTALQAKHEALRAAAKDIFVQRDKDSDSVDFDPLYEALERS